MDDSVNFDLLSHMTEISAFVIFFGIGCVLALIAIAVVPYWLISKRLGWSPWWGLLMIVPLGNLIWPYFVAFSEWPVDRMRRNDLPPSPPHA